jgi:hypothetical protein
MERRGLGLSGSGQGELVSSCKHGNEHSHFHKIGVIVLTT